MLKVFITGATGLLATNTINELLKSGYYVKALVRNKNKFKFDHLTNIELLEGDITDYTFLLRAIQECAYVIHAAAQTRQGLSNFNAYYNVNVKGTENVIRAAITNGVKKVIHVSTCNVFGFGTAKNPGNETFQIKKPFSNSLYVQSKIESQELALSFSKEIEVTIANPTFLIGAYDQKPSSGRIVLMAFNKKIIFYPPGGKNFVDVKDAAKGLVSALTNGKNNETYILSGENLSYKQFYRRLVLHSKRKSFLIKIPKSILIMLGLIGNILQVFNVENEISLTNMRILCLNNYYSNQKASKELNIKFNKIDNAIGDAVNWFKKNGYLK